MVATRRKGPAKKRKVEEIREEENSDDNNSNHENDEVEEANKPADNESIDSNNENESKMEVVEDKKDPADTNEQEVMNVDSNNVDGGGEGGGGIPRMKEMDSVLTDLLDVIDSMKSADPKMAMKASCMMLKLKAMQREIFHELQETTKEVQEKQAATERIETAISNLQYEEAHLEQQIDNCNSFELTNLKKMCQDELGADKKHSKEVDEDDEEGGEDQDEYDEAQKRRKKRNKAMSREHEVMNRFLQANIDEPDERSNVIARLHQEINWRGVLERDVDMKGKELNLVKSKLELQSKFLKGLPDKLRDMERASEPIQRFFHTQKKLSTPPTSPTMSAVHFIGSDRRTRLDMAMQLPGPLYTLFVQIQSHIDHCHEDSGIKVEVSSTTIALPQEIMDFDGDTASGDGSRFQPDPKVVLLHIPIPDRPDTPGSTSPRHSPLTIATATSSAATSKDKKKFLTIMFMYLPKLPIVTATTVPASNNDDRFIDHSTLLPYLFPEDDGDWTHFLSKQAKQQQSLSAATVANVVGKPYLWCNYIAGLHIHKGDHPRECLTSSTMVVIRELCKRVRANSTLTFLIKTFSSQAPNPVPVHPKMKDFFSTTTSCRLVKFKRSREQEPAPSLSYDNDNSQDHDENVNCTFTANIKRATSPSSASTSSNTPNILKAKVSLNLYRYPAIPPKWTLTCNEESWGEKHGTVTMLQSGTNPLHDQRLYTLQQWVNIHCLDEMTQEDNEETYDWILSHQLRQIIVKWDELVSEDINAITAAAASNNTT